MTNPYSAPSVVGISESPKLRSIVVCSAYFSLCMVLSLLGRGQAALRIYPVRLHDASTYTQFIQLMYFPLVLAGITVAFFAGYTVIRTRRFRILIGRVPLLIASVMFSFCAEAGMWLHSAVTANDSESIAQLPVLLVITAVLAEALIVRRHSVSTATFGG